jgi:hypothetical protein
VACGHRDFFYPQRAFADHALGDSDCGSYCGPSPLADSGELIFGRYSFADPYDLIDCGFYRPLSFSSSRRPVTFYLS